VRVTADSEIDYASVTTGLTNVTDPAGVIFDFTSNPNGDAFDWTGGTLTFRHNGASQGIVYRPSFSRTGFNYAGPVVITGNGTRQTVLQSTNTSGTQTWSGAISGNGSFRRVAAGGETDFSGANTFSGGTIVDGGTLSVSGSSATFGGGDVTVNAGNAAIAAGVSNAILDTATLTLLGGGTAGVADTGYINLGAGINDTVAALVLGATTEPNGTYGSSASSATFKMDEYFSGTGIITVGAASLPGDYNGDGKVDAADYVLWRKSPGSFGGDPAGYNTWRTNFGSGSPGSGSGLSAAAVPEPGSLSLVIFAISSVLATSGGVFRRRKG
jgi:autotransporter-associated beta strand protein